MMGFTGKALLGGNRSGDGIARNFEYIRARGRRRYIICHKCRCPKAMTLTAGDARDRITITRLPQQPGAAAFTVAHRLERGQPAAAAPGSILNRF